MKTNKGKLAKRSRLIKQDIDSKGKILKSSRVVKSITPKYLFDASAEHLVTAISCLATDSWDNQSFTKESYKEAVDYANAWREEYAHKHLAIRNVIIAVLIVLLIMWR